MAADLAATPRSGLSVQCCGDAHLSNFGLFARRSGGSCSTSTTSTRRCPGPWEWDVKRLAVSMLVAARDNGFAGKDQERVVLDTVGEYRARMAEFAAMRNLDVWYTRFEVEELVPRVRSQVGAKMRKRLDRTVAKAVDARQHAGVLEALARRSTGAAHRLRAAADRPARRLRARPRNAIGSEPIWSGCCGRTASRSNMTVERCSSSSGSSIWPARWWASAASGRVPGSRCCSAATTRIRCSCRSRRHSRRCSRSSPGERVPQRGRARRRRAADDAGVERHLPRLAQRRAEHPRQLRDYYVRQLRDWKGSIAIEAMDPRAMTRLRAALRGDACPRARALGRSHRDRRLPRPPRCLRPSGARVQRGLRRAERARLPALLAPSRAAGQRRAPLTQRIEPPDAA